MSVFRVTIDLFFDDIVDVQELKTRIQGLFSKVRNVPLEKATVKIHKCGHDSTPPTPCFEKIYEWEKP